MSLLGLEQTFGAEKNMCFFKKNLTRIQYPDILLTVQGCFQNRGTSKWIVYNGKPGSPIKMDDLGVFPLFLETPI